MAYEYDDQNIFAKILRGEIPNKTVMETEHSLAFADIAPRAPQHVLVIPKGAYVTFDHFAAEASEPEIIDYIRTVGKVAQQMGVAPDAGAGYRMLSNAGPDGHQEVPHLHVHIFAGSFLGQMINVPGFDR